MIEIHQQDREFLEQLGGKLVEGKDWRVLRRHGRVLLLVRSGARGARSGGRLYSPQRRLAQIAAGSFLNVLFWRLLPSLSWDWTENGPLRTLMRSLESPVGAILLGNPGQAGRRALLLTDEEEPRVFKIGWGLPARQLVADERRFLKNHRGDSDLVPEVIFDAGGDNWEAFGMPFFEQGPEVSLEQVCGVLLDWLEDSPRAVTLLNGWENLTESSQEGARWICESCRDLKLRPSLVHGDLAPWNIRRDHHQRLVCIDWEEGRTGGVPCWDALHFVFQRAALVDRLSSSEIGQVMEKAMTEGELAHLIEASGWKGREELLFGSYLIAMATERNHVSALIGPEGYRRKSA